MSNSSVFKVRLTVLKISADRHLYAREFQIEGALTLNAYYELDRGRLGWFWMVSKNVETFGVVLA